MLTESSIEYLDKIFAMTYKGENELISFRATMSKLSISLVYEKSKLINRVNSYILCFLSCFYDGFWK